MIEPDNKAFDFIKSHENDDIRSLALQSKRYPDIDMHFVIRQIEGRQIAQSKIPSWYNNDKIIYPQHISLEQCSSEKTAKYKASLCNGNSMVDLTGGLGIDFSFMCQRFEKAIYVEKQPDLSNLAAYNFGILNLKNVTIVNNEAEVFLKEMQAVDTIFIDPSRRSSRGKKTVLIEDCSPNLINIDSLLEDKSKQTIIKLSPMLDITLALKKINNISEVHIISINNECKELLLIKRHNTKFETTFFCINILSDSSEYFSFTSNDEKNSIVTYTHKIDKYLYEPNASILKAGAYRSLSSKYNIAKLHPNSHLYTSERLIPDFPGRSFLVKEVLAFNKQNIRNLSLNIKKANITIRNFPLSVDEIRKKTAIKDGGDLFIFATTLADEKKNLVICEKVGTTKK